MQEELNHSGYICLKENNQEFAYDLKYGLLTLHLYTDIHEIDGSNIIIANSFDNEEYAFGLSTPLMVGENHLFPINFNIQVEWLIKNFRAKSKYTKAIFTFAELQYFCPSTSVVKENDSGEIAFKRTLSIIKEFAFSLMGKECKVTIGVGAKGKYRISNSFMQAESVLQIEFDETDDIEFIKNVYYVVDAVFAFICNRRNTDCTYMELKGTFPDKTINNGQAVDCVKDISSYIHFINKYRENNEENKIISKTFNSAGMLKHIDSLFSLVAEDFDNRKGFENATISISSVHPSVKRRSLIDLQQSLQITGAYEFYVRKYLPSMVEEKDYHLIVKQALYDLSKDSSIKSKARKLACSLSNQVIREPALEDKIVKSYDGYSEWIGIKKCLKEEWFNPKDIRAFAHEANEWRNELAHSKREYEPNETTIMAIRLMEHMNYAIVLRRIGFEDNEIVELLDNMLVR